ncbi:hypothetical protein D3C71_2152470 [compost metagenome]
MVFEVGVEREQAAIIVVQPAWCTRGHHVQGRLIVYELVPLGVTLGETDQHTAIQQS